MSRKKSFLLSLEGSTIYVYDNWKEAAKREQFWNRSYDTILETVYNTDYSNAFKRVHVPTELIRRKGTLINEPRKAEHRTRASA